MMRRAPNTLNLTNLVGKRLRSQLPHIATKTVSAVVDEVPAYASAFEGSMGERIAEAVRMALAGFLNLAAQERGTDPGSPLRPALDAAYALGQGEARSERSIDALLAAYRVGARVAWREMAAVAVASRVPAETLSQFAELVFAYIDELSAASVSGHGDEQAASDRVRRRYRERLARNLLRGDTLEALQDAAAHAEWTPPDTLTVVMLPPQHSRGLLALSTPRWLTVADDLPGLSASTDLIVFLVPDVSTGARTQLRTTLAGRPAVIGPTRPWMAARASYDRAIQARTLLRPASVGEPLDTEEHLAELVIGADPDALADLRTQILAPLRALRPATAEKLTETLRAWLLHQGRREDVAAALFLHPQTVRYRMNQVRDAFGAQLDDPSGVFALTVALGPIASQ